jgi:hypothetical protein
LALRRWFFRNTSRLGWEQFLGFGLRVRKVLNHYGLDLGARILGEARGVDPEQDRVQRQGQHEGQKCRHEISAKFHARECHACT